MHSSVYGQVTEGVQLALCALAAWLGDRAVRIAALIFAAAALVYGVIQDHEQWIDPSHRALGVDAAQSVLLTALLLRHRRLWLAGAAVLQWLAALVDVVIIVDYAVAARAWLVTTYAFSWGALACILVGAVLARWTKSPSPAA